MAEVGEGHVAELGKGHVAEAGGKDHVVDWHGWRSLAECRHFFWAGNGGRSSRSATDACRPRKAVKRRRTSQAAPHASTRTTNSVCDPSGDVTASVSVARIGPDGARWSSGGKVSQGGARVGARGGAGVLAGCVSG